MNGTQQKLRGLSLNQDPTIKGRVWQTPPRCQNFKNGPLRPGTTRERPGLATCGMEFAGGARAGATAASTLRPPGPVRTSLRFLGFANPEEEKMPLAACAPVVPSARRPVSVILWGDGEQVGEGAPLEQPS